MESVQKIIRAKQRKAQKRKAKEKMIKLEVAKAL